MTIAAVGALSIASGAWSATVTGTRNISCNGTTYATLQSSLSSGGASLHVRQLSTTPSGLGTFVRAVRMGGGTTLGPKLITTGTANGVTWNSFAAGKYSVQGKSQYYETSCSNYSMDYLITY